MAHRPYATAVMAACALTLLSITPIWAQNAIPTPGGSLIIVLSGDPITTNPNVTSMVGDQISGCMVYEGLVFNKADGTNTPALATSWTISSDNLTYTFDLRKTTWQDGQPVTADDVRFSLTEVSAKYSPVFASAGKYIRSVEASGTDKVVITLKSPYGPFLRSLSCGNGGAVLPAHLFSGKGDVITNPASSVSPVGSGPFKLVEWQRGNFLRFAKNPSYWDSGKPYLDEIIAKIIPNPSSRVQALRSGEVDYINSALVANSDRASIASASTLQLRGTNYSPSQDMIFMNEQNAILAKPEVRKALMVATDRDYLVRNIFGGRSIPGLGPFTSQIDWAFNPEADFSKMYPFNEADAKARLDRAGYPPKDNGERFELNLVYDSNDGDSTRLVQAIQGMWRSAGVKVVLQGLDRPTIAKRVYLDRQFDMIYWTYGSFGDPAAGLTRIYSTATIGTPFGNPGGYSNPQVDALFAKAAGLSDLNERGEQYKKATALIAEDLPVLVLSSNNNVDASTKKFGGLWGYVGYGQWSDAFLAK